MTNLSKEIERRIDTRLDLSLPITLFVEPRIESISRDVCANGISFEVDEGAIESFSLGRTISFEIVANISTYRLPNKTVTLSGTGVIVRNAVVDNHKDNKKGCFVAVKFTKSLNVMSVSL
ncbi:MAG: hypothetical protein D8M57_12815 [Candidatus Scalindua sp. AMX11]|nr:MAG: hypothetical protein DWQ00_12335 [Candidatus Scalindua sp.]NOG83858.1 hypothetical protein [Planctomycetota bacterium]RZV83007.1 MAG: hypothetical protein EX341_09475 [Candidatus Scalindua sp. SCAELEC01]TDE64511.1 MAG: hypothetical protein D8M57_12815 [Candidatus Scalindua sp. AMX11]GJQ58749.1 MAG: hypothetical protein SCALA701_15500 [Candidatus Scalindua sp.]